MFFERHAAELVEHFVPEKSDKKEVSAVCLSLQYGCVGRNMYIGLLRY